MICCYSQVWVIYTYVLCLIFKYCTHRVIMKEHSVYYIPSIALNVSLFFFLHLLGHFVDPGKQRVLLRTRQLAHSPHLCINTLNRFAIQGKVTCATKFWGDGRSELWLPNAASVCGLQTQRWAHRAERWPTRRQGKNANPKSYLL